MVVYKPISLSLRLSLSRTTKPKRPLEDYIRRKKFFPKIGCSTSENRGLLSVEGWIQNMFVEDKERVNRNLDKVEWIKCIVVNFSCSNLISITSTPSLF